MAELVDAQVSGICVRKDVEVRVFLRAPFFFYRHLIQLSRTKIFLECDTYSRNNIKKRYYHANCSLRMRSSKE